jgi:hypothetical protein
VNKVILLLLSYNEIIKIPPWGEYRGAKWVPVGSPTHPKHNAKYLIVYIKKNNGHYAY